MAAIELPIAWNNINGVNDVDTLAQLIPLFVSVGYVLRVWVLHQVRKEQNNTSPETTASETAPEASEHPDVVYGSWPQWPPSTYRPSV